MIKKIIFTSLLLLFVGHFFCQSKKLENIIQNISKINVVEHAQIGDGSRIDDNDNGNIIESENYKNYKQLIEIASIKDLLKLTKHKNATVVCYASWALADTSYFDLKSILHKFIKNDRVIISYTGCIKSPENISIELYHRYWNNVEISKRQNDKLLFELDSTILYSKNSDNLLLFRALNNRIYDEKFNNQISYLAKKKGNEDAILYLNNWKNTKYCDSLTNIKFIAIDSDKMKLSIVNQFLTDSNQKKDSVQAKAILNDCKDRNLYCKYELFKQNYTKEPVKAFQLISEIALQTPIKDNYDSSLVLHARLITAEMNERGIGSKVDLKQSFVWYLLYFELQQKLKNRETENMIEEMYRVSKMLNKDEIIAAFKDAEIFLGKKTIFKLEYLDKEPRYFLDK